MTPHDLSALRAFVAMILSPEYRFDHRWTVQGFGMMRLQLPGNFRLHLWDSSLRVENVSDIHDHLQWGLMSTVICGGLVNRLYAEVPTLKVAAEFLPDGELIRTMSCGTLKPGVGTYFKDEPKQVRLALLSQTQYFPGDTYSQKPAEIHSTHPEDGTITLMQKFPTDDESARVYWPAGTEWVSAEPRAAKGHEIDHVADAARVRLMREWQIISY